MAHFDLPCVALFGGPSRWPEANLKDNCCSISVSHIQTSPSLISWSSQNTTLCAQNIKTPRLKADLDGVIVRNLWRAQMTKRALLWVCFPHIYASVSTVRCCKLVVELFSVNVNISIITAWNRIIYLFVHGHAVFLSNRSNWAHNWLWRGDCFKCTYLTAYQAPFHLTWQGMSLPDFARIWIMHKRVIIAAIQDHSATHTRTGSIKL